MLRDQLLPRTPRRAIFTAMEIVGLVAALIAAMLLFGSVTGCHSGAKLELGFMGASVGIQFAGPEIASPKPIVTVDPPPTPAPATPAPVDDGKPKVEPPK